MLGLRRFRAFLLLAFFTATAVYYIARTKRLSITDIDRLRNTYLDYGSSKNQQLDHNIEIPPPPGDAFGAAVPERVPTETTPNRTSVTTIDHDVPEAANTRLPTVPTPVSQEETTTLQDQERLSNQKEASEGEEVQKPEVHGQTTVDGSDLLRWRKQKEQNPIADDDLITLPSGQPRQLPKIQHDFKPETAAEKADRIKKQDVVRKSFEHAWSGYKKYAQPHDELKPISKDYADRKQFMGWGATLVDTLDTLWIMGLHDDFEEAVKKIKKIDFKSSTSSKIPLFETVIRYLGGLISAYDLTSEKYPVLLEKAVELADVLMGAFDTPNRMPVPFFEWSSLDADKPRRSHENTVLAEIGSMTMEFTRLAQLTGENKYYDAVARVTDSLEKFQSNTEMPGLWPLRLDSSGCKKAKATSTFQGAKEKFVKPVSTIPINTVEDDSLDGEEPAVPPVAKDASTEGKVKYDSIPYSKRAIDDHVASGSKSKIVVPSCDLQDLVHEPDATIVFGIGGQADSVYEYMPKMFALLGGLAPQYQTMYENASEVIRAELLFRPMIKDAKRNVLFSAKHVIDPKKEDSEERRKIVYEGTHLSCFAGGMFGLASKLFDTPADMEIAKRLTDGCVYAYESTVTGIMPEEFAVVPCESKQTCSWNKKKWYEALDPDMQERLDAVSLWNKNQERIYAPKGSLEDSDSEEVAIQTAPNRPQATIYKGGITQEYDYTLDKRQVPDNDDLRKPRKPRKPTSHFGDESNEVAGSLPFIPRVAVLHENFVQVRIQEERLPPGYTQIFDSEYKLRPEAIESVFIMWRLTGDDYWRQKGWMMFQSIQAATQTEVGNAAIYDVTSLLGKKKDVMESFWLAETLKYFYLLFSEPDVISLDEYILSTEAHPFKLTK